MRLRKFFCKCIVRCFNALAVLMVMQTANSACVWIIHQPEFPKEAEKFKKVL